MTFYSGHWFIPVNPDKCAAINRTVSCPFDFYDNRSVLPNDLKLKPNLDVTGPAIEKAFLASSIIALVLSSCLLLDKIKYHLVHGLEHRFYLRLIHLLESLLQVLSDQQIVAGIALLLAVNAQACEISAYHYNLVCTMLLLSAITHLNAFVSISDFIFKGKSVAINRLIAIVIQLVLSGIVLSARNTEGFPSKPGALGALPAACFEKMNAMHSLGLEDFANLTQNITGLGLNTTYNASQIVSNIHAATSAGTGLGEYITLIVFTIFALLFLLMEMALAQFFRKPDPHWSCIVLSFASTIASIVIVSLVHKRYHQLRSGMEIDAWFDSEAQGKWTYSQIVPLLLLASGSITLVKAITESLASHKGRRYIKVAEQAANDVLERKNKIESSIQKFEDQEDRIRLQERNYQYGNTQY